MVPEDIERHLLMNDARLGTYELARAEGVNFLESQHSLKLRAARIQRETRAANSDAMDVDSFQQKGKPRGKGKGKGKGTGKGKATKGSSGGRGSNYGSYGHYGSRIITVIGGSSSGRRRRCRARQQQREQQHPGQLWALRQDWPQGRGQPQQR